MDTIFHVTGAASKVNRTRYYNQTVDSIATILSAPVISGTWRSDSLSALIPLFCDFIGYRVLLTLINVL